MPYNFTIVPWFISKTTLLVVILGLLASWTQAPSSTDSLHYLSNSCRKTAVNSTFTEGSSFQASLNQTLLSEFPEKASKSIFSNFTTGIDQLYALYYCKGDVDHKTCHDCVQAAAVKVIDVCKLKKEAIIWYEECTLRYANRPIFTIDEEKPFYLHTNNTGIVNAYLLDPHQHTFDSLMDSVIRQAAYGSEAIQGFATKEVNLSSTQTLRGLAQCTPDIAGPKCYRCLKAALMLKDSWANTIIFLPSCFVRYDLYGKMPPDGDDPPVLPKKYLIPIIVVAVVIVGSSSFKVKFLVHTSLGTEELLLQPVIAGAHERRCCVNPGRRPLKGDALTRAHSSLRKVVRPRHNASVSFIRHPISKNRIEAIGRRTIKRFSYRELKRMTGDFENKKGEGGFGIVYSGWFGETKVAVKVLKQENATTQFRNEMIICERVSHENIVSLIGYCDDKRKLSLVYEFMDGKDLKTLLLENADALTWTDRLSIASDAAKGLAYLHNQCDRLIVHRDVKPSNILVSGTSTNQWRTKIADFGTCRIFPDETISTIFTSQLWGTPRYTDPVYMENYSLNEKVDAYSFGVVLLELIFGMSQNVNERSNLIFQVKDKVNRKEDITSMVHSRVNTDVGKDYSTVKKAVDLAVACVHVNRDSRPTMVTIVEELNQCLKSAATNTTMPLGEIERHVRDRTPAEVDGKTSIQITPAEIEGSENENHNDIGLGWVLGKTKAWIPRQILYKGESSGEGPSDSS